MSIPTQAKVTCTLNCLDPCTSARLALDALRDNALQHILQVWSCARAERTVALNESAVAQSAGDVSRHIGVMQVRQYRRRSQQRAWQPALAELESEVHAWPKRLQKWQAELSVHQGTPFATG